MMIFRAPEVASFLGSFLGGTTPRGSATVTSSSVSVPWLSTCYTTFGNDVAFVFARLRVSISRLSGSDFLGLHVSSAHKCSVAMQTDISRAPCSNHHEGPSSWLDGHIAPETNFYTCPSPSSAQDCVTCPSKRKEALALTDLASGLAKRTRPPRRQVSSLSVFSGRSCSRYRLCQFDSRATRYSLQRFKPARCPSVLLSSRDCCRSRTTWRKFAGLMPPQQRRQC